MVDGKGNQGNPIKKSLKKKEKPNNSDRIYPLFAGNIICSTSFINWITVHYIKTIDKICDMGPHNSEDVAGQFGPLEDNEIMLMSRAATGLNPFKSKTSAVVRKAIKFFWEIRGNPLLQSYYTSIVTT